MTADEARTAVSALANEYRARCLWFLRPDYHPATDAERLTVLEYIQRYGDRAAFVRGRAAFMPHDLVRRAVCRLIAENRIASGESYVAGAAALNELIAGSRVSRDLDLFHDTDLAVTTSWEADRSVLERNGYSVVRTRALPSFIEAQVIAPDGGAVRLEWARDSAYRIPVTIRSL